MTDTELNTPALMGRLGLSHSTLGGRVAVVTGAGRGIGRETARALAWLGAKVVVAELNLVPGTETSTMIQRDGGEALFIQTDVSSLESVTALATRTHTAFGSVDILINNAILCPVASVAEMDVALWDQVVAVNLRGAFLTCKTFLPEMLAKRRGTIVNMISTDAMPGLAAYIATKQGLVGFSQSLALETQGQGVQVIPFGPGMVDTPGMRSVAPGLAPRLGLSEEQFLTVPLHPAFAGLMPAEYAGVATAYLVAALADEYHGEPVTGYTVLERAGIIPPVVVPESIPQPEQPVTPPLAAPRPSIYVLAGQLKVILVETVAELEHLPVFARPLAKNGFKSKAGASLSDWQRLVDGLQAGQPPLPDLPVRLEKLATYYREVPKETARFTRDADLLRQVSELCERRIGVINSLRQVLT
jgi:NAD(P)-dependent dehydrogenase (short-subunit alcohol dehydrogenase family)